MNKNLLTISSILLILLGIAMLVIGFTGKLILPPIITGIGFFIIAVVFLNLREKNVDPG